VACFYNIQNYENKNEKANKKLERTKMDMNKHYITNPETGRPILKNGSVGRRLKLENDPNFMKNPSTGRYIRINGPTHKKIIRRQKFYRELSRELERETSVAQNPAVPNMVFVEHPFSFSFDPIQQYSFGPISSPSSFQSASSFVDPIPDIPPVKEEKSGDECVICFEDIPNKKNRTCLDCGHIFHFKCISQIRGQKCPLCRKPFGIPERNYSNPFSFAF
jgi:Ring finger domain/2-cysteine adaptor domain